MCPECLSLSSVSHYLVSCLFALMDRIEIQPLKVTKTEQTDVQARVNLMSFSFFLSFFLLRLTQVNLQYQLLENVLQKNIKNPIYYVHMFILM